MDNNVTCSVHTANDTTYGLIRGYSGIPENLVFNLIFFGCSLIAFLFVRRFIRDQDIESPENNLYRYIVHPKSIAYLNISDLNPLTVVWKTVKLSLKEIGQKCGHDASIYLFFQLHLIVYCFILCILSIAIVLPMNFQGNLNGNRSTFGFSTISNLPASSNFLWGPIIVNIFANIIGIIVMLHFAYTGNITNKNSRSGNTLMLKNVPREYCSVDEIETLIKIVLPNEKIDDITIAYDIWRLNKIVDNGKKLKAICKGCDVLDEQLGDAGLVYHCCCGYYCSKLVCRCCKIKFSNASEFYKRQLAKHTSLIDEKASEALQNPTGIIFIEFQNDTSAQRAINALTTTGFMANIKRFKISKSSSTIELIQPTGDDETSQIVKVPNYNTWKITYSPQKDNIYWQNLTPKRFRWYLRIILLNATLFILSIILTTPSIVLNSIDKILSTTVDLTGADSTLSVIIVNVLPPLILKMTSSILPPVIGHSSQLERHYTRSRKAKSHINKAYYFLLFTVLIIPSLGLTGINGFLRWLFEVDSSNGLSFQWQCIFLPDNGAFYVNYVITAALFGTGLDLLRLPELISLGLNLLFSRSRPEQLAIYELERTEFTYCSAYASLICVFSLICAYSMVCPLITVFGLLYFIIKFMIDKYNIFFVAAPTLIKQRIHLSAFRCALMGLLLPHIFLLIFMALKTTGKGDARLIFQAIILAIFMLNYFVMRLFGHEKMTFGVISPIIDTVPALDITLTGAKEVTFKRYYPNYLLKYVGENKTSEVTDMDGNEILEIS